MIGTDIGPNMDKNKVDYGKLTTIALFPLGLCECCDIY